MDPAAHFLTGAMLAKSVSGERRERALFWTLGIAAMIPDLDVVFSPWGERLYFLYHRGFTHSFVGGFLLAIPLAVYLWKKKIRSFPVSLTLAVAGVWVHLLGDWATSFGTPLLLPFSQKNFALDFVGNLNWVFWFVGGGLLWYLRHHGRRALALVSITLFLLLGYQWLGRAITIRLMKGEVRGAVIPHLLNPLLWRIHVTDLEHHEYRLYHAAPFVGKRWFVLRVPITPQSPVTEAAMKDSPVRLFFKHNRWPVVEVEKLSGGGWLVRWSNLLYYWRGRWGERIETVLDENLNVVESRKVFQAWE